MHVSNVNEVLFVLACNAYCRLPLLYQFKNLCLNWAGKDGWPLGEAFDELVEKFLCSHLEVERVAAILDEVVQELPSVHVSISVALLCLSAASHM